MYANPVIQVGVVMGGTSGRGNARVDIGNLNYNWLDENLGLRSTMVLTAKAMTAYVFAGLFFAWRAKRRFRRDVF